MLRQFQRSFFSVSSRQGPRVLAPQASVTPMATGGHHVCHEGCNHHSHSDTSRGFSTFHGEGGATKAAVEAVLSKNKEWAARKKAQNEGYFRPLSEGQAPKYFVISCADSRCPTEKMMGFEVGECFTVRNIANCVMQADISINAATQFAVEVLGVQDILVIGHYDCGGVKAAMTRQSFGTTVDMYVRHVRDVYRTHLTELDAIEDQEERLNQLIKKHVQEQCINIFKMGFVQRARRKSKENGTHFVPQIHGLIFNPSTGLLEYVPLELSQKAQAYGKVYDVLHEGA